MQLVWNPGEAEQRGELRVSQSPLLNGTSLLIMELNKCGHCREFPGEYKRVRGRCWLGINTNNSKEFIHSQVSPAGKPLRGHCAVTALSPAALPALLYKSRDPQGSSQRSREGQGRELENSWEKFWRSFYSAWRWDWGQDLSWAMGKPAECVLGMGSQQRMLVFNIISFFFLFVFYIQSPESKHHIRAQGLKMTLETKKLLLNMGEPRGKAVKIVHKQQLGSFLCSQTSGTCLFTFAQTHLT